MSPHRNSPATPYGRFALFIDGSNFYHTIRELGLHVDYRRVLEHFQTQGTLVRASYYTALLPSGQTPDWLVRLTDWLAYNGYRVVTKEAHVFTRPVQDETGEMHLEAHTRGNTDLELVVDMLILAPHCDTLILFSGAGDFRSVVEAVQRQGCRVLVVSSSKTSTSTIADELRRQADEFTEISALTEHIKMADR